MNRKKVSLAVALAAALLGACLAGHAASPAATPSPERPGSLPATPSPTQTLTPTTRPTTPPTPEPPPTRDPALPTPSLPNSSGNEVFFRELLFDDTQPSSGCELPCWQGLEVGVANADDIQNMYDTVFNFDGSQDFFVESNEIIESGYYGADVAIPNLFASGYQWYFGADRLFNVTSWLNKDANTLAGLRFKWSTSDPSEFLVHVSPQDFLKELGTPSHMLVNARLGLSSEADLVVVYDQGIVLYMHGWLPITRRSESEAIVELCLRNAVWDGGLVLSWLYLLEPFTNGLNDMSPLQEAATIPDIERRGLRPIEEVFGTSPSDITQLARSSSNPCIYADIHPS